MKRKSYPSDVTDQQWALVEPLLPRVKRRPAPGRPREVDLREVVNALFYHAREGCFWRALPHDFPAWDSVDHYFREWSADPASVRHALHRAREKFASLPLTEVEHSLGKATLQEL